jgi:hypothetical protein
MAVPSGAQKDSGEWELAASRITDIGAELNEVGTYWYEVSLSKDIPGLWHGMPGVVLVHKVRVLLAKGPDGRLVCTGLIVGALRSPDPTFEIQARTLREIPLTKILRRVAVEMAKDPKAAEFFDVGLEPFDQPRLRPGRKGHSSDFYSEVARLYHAARQREPRRYVVAVRETLNSTRPKNDQASDRTVRRWIKQALKEEKEKSE